MEVWKYLHMCKATVEVDDMWQPEANREQDTVIMETLIASGRFTNKELKEINYCLIYLQELFISDITNLEGNKIEEWAGRGHAYTLYHHVEGVWTQDYDTNIGRLRFQVEAHYCDATHQYSHVVEVCERARYKEIVGKHKVNETQILMIEHMIEYTSGIGDSCHTQPRHIKRLVGNLPDIEVPRGLDVTEEHDMIVATNGSVVFGVGYLSWVVAMDNKQVLLMGGGPDDGDQLLMTSYRSKLGVIASGLAVIGTLVRSGKIKVKSFKLVCDKEAAIKACTRKRTQSVFPRPEGDHDLISMIHYLQ
jgi:hypothetical protein